MKTIPGFRTEKKEHEFWSTHSSADYNMEEVSETIEFDSKARTQQISLRLPHWLIEELKMIAADEGIPYQRLIKNCLKELVAVRKKAIDI
ncbi:hypothetical protein HYR99_00360 [Candidatus Poribacteria bacterium]|nr:hypothetical protein [Candidatus Poribacteria bacterium]